MLPSDRSSADYRYRQPVKDNISRGQATGNQIDSNFIDPRLLPLADRTLIKVLRDRSKKVDEEACESEGIHTARVKRTIDILNLHAERLRSARTTYWTELVERSGQFDDPDQMNAWIRSVLILG